MIPSASTDLLQITQEDDMVYTEGRLKRALDVFRASEPYRKRRSLPGSNLEQHLESRCKQYETRSGKSSLVVRSTFTGTWNDPDESGDYTPSKKRTVTKIQKTARTEPKRKRCDVVGLGGDRAPKRNKVSYTTGRQRGLSLEVTFKFRSDTAKGKVAKLFPATDSDVELYHGGGYMSDRDKKDAGEKDTRLVDQNEGSLFPPSQAPSSLGHGILAHSHEHDDAKSQSIGSTRSAIRNDPTHYRVSIACESDPIIIEDSDDTGMDYGYLLHNPELHRLATQTKMIKTNWAHPVDYRCKPEACNFCLDFRYPLFGCGAVNIEVIQLEPGVYEEMGGGHRERGMAPTKICLNCSLERIAIAKCHRHEILRIEGFLEEEFDFQSFFSEIAASPQPEHPTCSICIKPAFYACATRQTEDPFGIPITGEDATGCGLLLCGDCAAVVVSCGLSMEYLEGFAESSKILRADRDFLLPGSDLWQAWRK